MTQRTPVVIDTDPGIDDVVALALAATAETLEVLAVTTTYGNAPLQLTTRNARRVLDICGRGDIPVLPGSDRPPNRPLHVAPENHGDSGVGYAPVPSATVADGTANEFALLEVLSRAEQPVDLLTLGPLTNLAAALEADERIVRSRVRRHLGTFGSLDERGSADRWADFNSWCDPEAVDRVLQSGLGTVMIGLDVTRRMSLGSREVNAIGSSTEPLAQWLGSALRFYVESHAHRGWTDGCVLNDVLAVGELLHPGLLTCDELRLTVNTAEGERRGQTTVDGAGMTVWVAFDVDVPRMRSLLGVVLGARWRDQDNPGGRA